MALPYNVWSEEDIKNRHTVEKGIYPFEIISAVCKKTNAKLDDKGQVKPIHDMLEIEFNFWDQNGVIRKLKDWIVFIERMDWKLRHLANSIGLLELYESKTMDVPHLLGKKGSFNLGIKDLMGNDGVNKKMNFVLDYVKNPISSDSFADDDIPL